MAERWGVRVSANEIAQVRSEADMIDSIRTLTRALHDGHARVERDGRRGFGWLPVRTTCIGDAVVITTSEAPDFARGDVVTHIDGVPARPRATAIAQASLTLSAS